LANSVEEFTYCLLDPLKSDEGWCEQFGDYSLDNIMDDAIELEQKKVNKKKKLAFFLCSPNVNNGIHRAPMHWLYLALYNTTRWQYAN